MKQLLLTLTFGFFNAALASAGTTYEVTSSKGDKTITYKVNFGGGKLFEQYTAFDPVSGEFVYLSFKRGGKAPEAVTQIFDHATGKKVDLFKFPGVQHPLPVIPQIKDIKVCPKTGDPNFKAKKIIMYD